MPFRSVNIGDLPHARILGVEHKEEVKEVEVSWGKAMAAGFARENMLSSYIRQYRDHPGPLTDDEEEQWLQGDFNPLDEIAGTRYETDRYLSTIAEARSPRELEWTLENIDRLERNEQILAEAGTGKAMTSGIMGALFDPIMAPTLAIPAIRGTLAAKVGGTAATAGVLSGASEVGLHSTQPSRTKAESALNIGAATLFGSVLGTLGPRLDSDTALQIQNGIDAEVNSAPLFKADTTFRPMTDDLDNMNWHELRRTAKREGVGGGGTRAAIIDRLRSAREAREALVPTDPGGGGGSVPRPGTGPGAGAAGAQRVEGQTLPPGFRDELQRQVDAGKLSPQQAARQLRDKELEWTALKNESMFKVFKFASPVLRVALSKSAKAREILENLVEDSFIRQKNTFGYTSDFAVETISKAKSHIKEASLYDITGRAYKDYIGNTSSVGRAKGRFRDKEFMNREQFNQEVGKAMARGDDHPVPEVAAAAKSIRSNISKPMEDELIREKLIPTDVEGNPMPPVGGDLSYFPRVYNWGKIAGDRVGFKNHIIKQIREKIRTANELRPDSEGLAKFDSDQFQIELNAKLDKTIEQIIGAPHGYMPSNIVPQAGFLKGRKITLGFDDLEPWLNTDVIQVQRSYLQNVVPQLELQKRFSGIEMEQELAAISKDYTERMAELEPHSRAMAKMERERKMVIDDIQSMRDILLHRFERPRNPSSVWNQAGHFVRGLNFMRALGGVTVSSLPDLGQTIARMGLRPVASSFMKLASAPTTWGLSRSEAKRMGAGLDAVLHTRANLLMMASEESVAPVGRLSRWTDKGVRGMSKISGMAYWNSGLKQFAAIVYADEIGRMAAKGGKLSQSQITRLAAARISQQDWDLIVKNFQTHGTKEGGLWVPHIDEWDEEAADIFRSALLKEVDTSVVTPGAGDIPLVARTPVGKVIAQFKSFILTAHNRIFLAGMQRAMLDPRGATDQAAGLMAMMALGTMAYSLKEIAAGRKPETKNWNTLSREALNHSGYIGWLMDANNLTEKMTRGKIGLSAAFGHMGLGDAEPLTRYHTKSVVEDLLGPTLGTATDATVAASALIDKAMGEEITESDIRAIRRLTPFQNLIYARRMFNEVEQGAIDRWAQ